MRGFTGFCAEVYPFGILAPREVAMDYRNLGRSGLKVSPLCLGTMMLGRWGNTDEAECVRMVHRALDAGINFIDTSNNYGEGSSEEIVGKALAGRRNEAVLATKVWSRMGPGPNEQGLSRKAIQEQVEASLRRLADRRHRPLPDPPPRPDDAVGGDALGADRPRPPGEGPLHRLLDEPRHRPRRQPLDGPPRGVGDRRDALDLGAERLRALGLAPAALLDPAADDGGRALPGDAALRHREPRLEPARGGLAHRQVPEGAAEPARHAAGREVGRGPRRTRSSRRRIDVVEELLKLAEEKGTSLARFALKWTLRHPAVTSTIIGPRTMAAARRRDRLARRHGHRRGRGPRRRARAAGDERALR